MKKRIENYELIISIGFVVMNAMMLFYRLYRGDFEFQDFHARWQECAYFIRGINPFDVLGGKTVDGTIGAIDPDMVTVPWAWIWGIIINPGFLSYNVAKVYGVIIYILTPIITTIVCYRYCSIRLSMPNKWSLAAALSVCAQYCWIWSFLCGNHGAIACCLILISVFVYDERPILAGILLTIAMIKPQVTLPFLFVFLVMREYKVIITVFFSEVITVGIIQIVLHRNIFELLKASAGVGTNLEGVFFGLFNMLKYCGANTSWILVFDILVGIAFTVLVMYRMGYLKFGKESKFAENGYNIDVFWGASIASTFWFYKQSHDFVIMTMPIIILIIAIYYSEVDTKRLILISVQLLLMGIFYMQSLARRLCLNIVPTMKESFSKELFTNISCLIFIIVTFVYVEKIKRKE